LKRLAEGQIEPNLALGRAKKRVEAINVISQQSNDKILDVRAKNS